VTTDSPPAVVWFRRDLRLHDHPGLVDALNGGREVVPLFVLDDALLHGRWPAPNRAWFLLGSLRALAAELAIRGSGLLVIRGRPGDVVPAVADLLSASTVVASRDPGPYGRRRDAEVAARLGARGRELRLAAGVLAVEPEAVRSLAGRPYSVFTPFRRAWENVPRRTVLGAPPRIPAPAGLSAFLRRSALPWPCWWSGAERGEPAAGGVHGSGTGSAPFPTLADLGFDGPTADQAALPPPGEPAARDRLERWIADGLDGYGARRDLLAVDGTSRLSADLHLGLLSPSEVVQRCSGPGDGQRAFVAELAWREFFHHVLWHEPQVARRSFRLAYEAIPWRQDPDGVAAWEQGHTGYPVADAAMRQLAATGWMHNRGRMVAASFLTRDLLVHWRVGEAHFMRHLVDGDLASNNGGWQWIASTGIDAQPYFRILDPVAQGRRFDPDGAYVRRWVPELRNVPDPYVHAPWTMPRDLQDGVGCRIGADYPAPIVDHAAARARAMAAFRSARQRPAGSGACRGRLASQGRATSQAPTATAAEIAPPTKKLAPAPSPEAIAPAKSAPKGVVPVKTVV
jgi:deoxyribodipyrimidine photo-lyase